MWSEGFELYDLKKHRHHAFLYGGHDPGVCCAYHAADLLWLLGYPDQALQKSHDSLIMARELSHPSTTSSALSFAAWFHQYRGDRHAVKARVEENTALASEQGFSPRRAMADFLRGWLLVEEGDSEAGITQMSRILDSHPARGVSGRWMAHCAALQAEVLGKFGRFSEALDVATKALARKQESGGRHYEPELHRIKGELLLQQTTANEREAEACFQNALKVAQGQSAKSLELRAAMSLSRLWYDQGKKAEARQLLGEIYGWFTEGFDTVDLKQAKALLEEIA